MKKTKIQCKLEVIIEEWVNDPEDCEEISDIITTIEGIEGVEKITVKDEYILECEESDMYRDDEGD